MDAALVHEQLRQRAFLHDDPDAYLAGVDDALAVVEDAVEDTTPVEQAQVGA